MNLLIPQKSTTKANSHRRSTTKTQASFDGLHLEGYASNFQEMSSPCNAQGVMTRPYIPDTACEKELNIHNFLSLMRVYSVNVKIMLEEEAKTNTLSTRLLQEFKKIKR